MQNNSPSSKQNNTPPKNGERVNVTITYLEQSERPVLPTPPRPRSKVAILRAEKPPIHFYRYLYRLVGDPYNWVSRRRMSDESLAAIIHDPSVYVYVLYVNGAPGGIAEVDARNKDAHEIKFFGLAPDQIGGGLGRYFLTNVIDLAWSHGAHRVQLETCTLDHPAALPLYQKFGFRVIDRREGVVELMSQPQNPH
ncbi:MAG: N-acetyltransferase [Hyphococcus sp.]|nr:MAG: N-acetyltransferase [Marinicaulis sp.]